MVREFTTPVGTPVTLQGNLTDMIVANAAKDPGHAVFARRNADGTWYDVSTATFLAEVTTLAKGLIAEGIGPGHRVAIFSKTRYEWVLLDYALWFAGAVSVPIYETSSAEQVRWILADADVTAAVVETAEHRRKINGVREGLPLEHLWTIDDGDLDLLARVGTHIEDAALEARRTAAVPDDIATIVYTSGTTGQPKGCPLTHGNFLFECGTAIIVFKELLHPGASSLLFLPLAHVFARIFEVACVLSATKLGFMPTADGLAAELTVFRPSFLVAVPRVFEKVYNAAASRAAASGALREGLFRRSVEAGVAYSEALDAGGPSLTLRLRHLLWDALVYRKLRRALGGRCEYAVSGGAPLGPRLAHFYRSLGVTVLEGYGLTETCAAFAANSASLTKIGTVGQPFPGTSVRVADDGELLYKGAQIFSGYWKNDAATKEAFDGEGWFRSGDIGSVDEDGFIAITGRKKEILVTANGKNVAPAVLEDRMRAHLLIDQCMVVGDGQPFIAALVTLDHEALEKWASQRGKALPATGGLGVLLDDPDVHAEVEAAVDDANQAVSRAESIRAFRVLDTEWSEEGGQLTPSLKLKRNVVYAEHAADIAAIYAK